MDSVWYVQYDTEYCSVRDGGQTDSDLIMMSVSKEFQILIPPTRQHLDKKIFDLLLLLSPGEGSDSTSQGNTTDLVALNDRGTHKLRREEIDQAVIHRNRRQRTDLQAVAKDHAHHAIQLQQLFYF